MGHAALDVHAIKPRPRTIGIAGQVHSVRRSVTVWNRASEDRVTPEVLRPLNPEVCANRQRDSGRCQRQDKLPPARGQYRRVRWSYRCICRGRIVLVVLCCSKIPTARPCVQLRTESIDRAHPVMEVPVNRHPLALLPALHRGYVAVQVCRDFLPRIQPLFGWSRRNCSPIALLIGSRFIAILGARMVTLPAQPRQEAVFDGKSTNRGNSAREPGEGKQCQHASKKQRAGTRRLVFQNE